MQEARGIVESLAQISAATTGEAGQHALQLRLSEQYLDTLKSILSESNVMVIPGTGAQGGSDNLSPARLATLMALYKQIVGPAGQAALSNSGVSSDGHTKIIDAL